MYKSTIFAIIASVMIIGAIGYFSNNFSGEETESSSEPSTNVYMENGKQVVEITAKGGYYPAKTIAQAGVETILRIKSQGTFDCSAAFVLPKTGFRTFLKSTGTEDVPLSADQAQGVVRGTCSMGMYNFSVNFS